MDMENSIEKLDFEQLIKEHTPFTTFMNKVIQAITDPIAGYIWVHLSTLPPKWKVNKYYLMKKMGIGEQKLKKHMAYLARVNLIEYSRPRNSDGTLGKVTIKVLCGNDFVYENDADCTDDTTGMKNHPVDQPPSGESDTYKRNINKEIKETTTTESKPEQEPETPTTTIEAPEIEQESKPSQEHVVVFESKGQDQFVLSKLKGTPKKHAPNCSQTRWLKEIKFHIDKHYPDNFNHGVCAVVKLLKFHAWTTPKGYIDLEEQEQIRLENERKHQAMLKAQEEAHNRKMAEMQRKPAHIEKTTHNIPKLSEIFDNMYKSLGKTRNTECFG